MPAARWRANRWAAPASTSPFASPPAPDDAQRFARSAVSDGHDLVAAWGGDGTVNGVGAALAGTPVAMAIIPGGSGNGLARDLGVPLDAAAAFEVAASGANRADRCRRPERLAVLQRRRHWRSMRASPGAWPPRAPAAGLLGYVIATFSELPTYIAARLHDQRLPAGDAAADHDRRRCSSRWPTRVSTATARRSRRSARLDDGELDIVVVRPQSLLRIASRIPAFFNGTPAGRTRRC